MDVVFIVLFILIVAAIVLQITRHPFVKVEEPINEEIELFANSKVNAEEILEEFLEDRKVEPKNEATTELEKVIETKPLVEKPEVKELLKPKPKKKAAKKTTAKKSTTKKSK